MDAPALLTNSNSASSIMSSGAMSLFVLWSLENRTATQRATETQTHPETVRHLARRFRQQGTLGLFPEHTEISTPSRGKPVPDTVIEELARLKALYHGFGYRELARILLHKTHYRIDDKTVKRLWEHSASPVQGNFPLARITIMPTSIKHASKSSNSTIKAGVSAVSVSLCRCRVPPSIAGFSALKPSTSPTSKTRVACRIPRPGRSSRRSRLKPSDRLGI